MAAYAALASLFYLIDRLQHHPLPPVSLDEQQVESLTKNITFLQEFLEEYNSPFEEEVDPLESRIADVACATKAILESYIAHTILLSQPIDEVTSSGDESDSSEEIDSRGEVIVFGKTKISVEKMGLGDEINYINFYQDLQQVIEDMLFIKIEVMGIVEEKRVSIQNQLKRNVSMQWRSMVGMDDGQNRTVVVSHEVSYEFMNNLTGGRRDRQVIPISGMGGIGKTTFARYIYEKPLIKEHFDVRVWATISQQYNTKEILCELLSQAKNESKEGLSSMCEDEVGLALYQYLSGRRYLIVMDDMWSIEAWDKLQFFFPENTNNSRIVVTTRLSKLASQLGKNCVLEMKFLDGVSSWNLFSKTVFGEKSCPLELEDIGRKIVESCRGLPLAIVVIGGLLENLEHTQKCWESVKKKLNSIVNLENDKHCFKILKLSYNHLPVYLKPCFLYMGLFEEDFVYEASRLIKLWISEGFVKPASGETLETTAMQYLDDLVARNLILVHSVKFTGNVKSCKIHDLLRDLCMKEAGKERFYNVIGQYSPQCQRSIPTKYFPKDVIQIVYLSYFDAYRPWMPKFPSSVNLLWNLSTLYIGDVKQNTITLNIWKMPQFRHAVCHRQGIHLPDPPSNDNVVIMENLQTFMMIVNFKCSEEVVRRIPNIRKLGITYESARHKYCLSNLEYLSKLESLFCVVESKSCDHLEELAITFPHSLVKLILYAGDNNLDEVVEKLGSLPLLQHLELRGGRFGSHKLEIGEGRFPNLKILCLQWCAGLDCWTLDGSSMPCLEQLFLSSLGVKWSAEIPSEIGEISTLKSITFYMLSDSTLKSLKKIVEEQEELQGTQPFHIRGRAISTDPELLGWEIPGIRIAAPHVS